MAILNSMVGMKHNASVKDPNTFSKRIKSYHVFARALETI